MGSGGGSSPTPAPTPAPIPAEDTGRGTGKVGGVLKKTRRRGAAPLVVGGLGSAQPTTQTTDSNLVLGIKSLLGQ